MNDDPDLILSSWQKRFKIFSTYMNFINLSEFCELKLYRSWLYRRLKKSNIIRSL